ncbi:MAG TPA: amidohydrolase [Rhizomicrobium sp.]|jgi:hippurate hydrolase|nr:amidohydrolase [Rhizomicrobium sp.]
MAVRKLVLGTALLALMAGPAAALDVAALKPGVDAEVAADYPHLLALYKDIHAHPELGFQETRTAAKLAGEMRALGLTVTEGVGKTGLVAISRNGAGPTILIRTELDALPMEEKTGLAYASHDKAMWNGRETFVDHSCGHDVHMAIWVGTAKALLAMKDKWRGTLMFVGQPAEETVSGATAMLADGLYTRFGKPNYAVAIHDSPEAAGTLMWRFGAATTTADSLDVTFLGRGGHGAMPERTIDPVVMAARFIEDVQTVISREKDPAAFGVVTIGAMEAGSAANIIPDHAALHGTIRTVDEAVRTKMLDGIRRTANGVAAIAGAPPPKIEMALVAHAVVNDQAVTSRTATALKQAFGAQAMEQPAITPASEDFSEFLRAGVPGTFLIVGATDPKLVAAAAAGGAPVPGNHSPLFAPVPEPTIKAGVEAMTLTVMNLLPKT